MSGLTAKMDTLAMASKLSQENTVICFHFSFYFQQFHYTVCYLNILVSQLLAKLGYLLADQREQALF